MPQMSPETEDQLAQQALSLKIAVGKFLDQFFDTLTPTQRAGLQALRVELGDEIDHLNAVAILLSLEGLQASLAHIEGITKNVNHTVAHVREIGKVIGVANALIDLGSAIASADPAKVLAAIESASNSLRS